MLELIKKENFASSLLLALDDENSSKYREECLKKNIEPDFSKFIGMTHEKLFRYFYDIKKFSKNNNGWEMKFVKNDFMGLKLDHDLIDSNSGKVIAKLGEKFNVVIAKKIEESGLKNLYVGNDFLIGKYLAKDIFDEKDWNNLL